MNAIVKVQQSIVSHLMETLFKAVETGSLEEVKLAINVNGIAVTVKNKVG